jgi:hypothetical protein
VYFFHAKDEVEPYIDVSCSLCGSSVPSNLPFVLKQLSKSVSVGRRSDRECSARRLEILFGKYFAIQRAALDTQKEQQHPAHGGCQSLISHSAAKSLSPTLASLRAYATKNFINKVPLISLFVLAGAK